MLTPMPTLRHKDCWRYQQQTNQRTAAVGSSNLFERLNAGRPPPVEGQPKPEANTVSSERAQKLLPAQKLLDWLQHWGKPTIRVRDIRIYGPRSLRGRESAIDSAQILQKEGWLIPLKTRRRDSLEWQVVRKPIIQPTVATVATVAAK
jgi:hypothetical protein